MRVPRFASYEVAGGPRQGIIVGAGPQGDVNLGAEGAERHNSFWGYCQVNRLTYIEAPDVNAGLDLWPAFLRPRGCRLGTMGKAKRHGPGV
jgi:hypothetical protein